MFNVLLFRYFNVSVIIGILILLLYLISPYINRVYNSKLKFYIWLVIAAYLIFPINIPVLNTPVKIFLSDTDPTVTTYINSNLDKNFKDDKKATEISRESNTTELIISFKDINIFEKLPVIWGIGVCLFLILECFKYLIFKKRMYRWSKNPQDNNYNKMVEDISKNLRIKTNIPILICCNIYSPLLLGYIHPYIFLPHENFNKTDLNIILHHELTHYKRKDLWYKLLILIANAVHWFNPIIYMMRKLANADLERACDDKILNDKDYEYRKLYSEVILSTINKHQKANALTTYFYGGLYIMKERFKNILEIKKKSRGRIIFTCICFLIISTNSLVACGIKDNVNQGKDNSIGDEVDEDKTDFADKEALISFSEDFINLFNGTIANQEEVSLEDFILNDNLKSFANKMIELTKKQKEKGLSSINYGNDNEFGNIDYEEISEGIYYLKVPFKYQGSGMTCQLLIKYDNKSMEILDFYFGSQDGVDTITTGHHTERVVENVDIWNDENWVTSVFEKMLIYEEELENK